MLRFLVLLLLLLNGGFFVWQQGYVDPWLGSLGLRESNRTHQQINPERLVVEGETEPLAEEARSATASNVESPAADPNLADAPAAGLAPVGPTLCLEAGPFSDDEATQVTAALGRSLPAGSWRTDRFPVPGLWLIYMGPYADAAALQSKQSELNRIGGVNFEEVRSPESLRMGFSLGRYNSEAAANAALQALLPKGVRTARVENVRQPTDVSVVRVQQADVAMQQKLKAMPLPPERGFVACLAP